MNSQTWRVEALTGRYAGLEGVDRAYCNGLLDQVGPYCV